MVATRVIRRTVLLCVMMKGLTGAVLAADDGGAPSPPATPQAPAAVDYDSMIREQMRRLETMKQQMATTEEVLIERNMADPAIRAMHERHVAAAVNAGQAPLDLREFTKRYLATSGFQVPYRPRSATSVFIENEERRAWEAMRQREATQGAPAR